nr:MAG TPA: hypothetical protein [Crassvirales sp.]DAU12251.1 MAG TPA: hypothetical protein [Caudoviricetes sp.]
MLDLCIYNVFKGTLVGMYMFVIHLLPDIFISVSLVNFVNACGVLLFCSISKTNVFVGSKHCVLEKSIVLI